METVSSRHWPNHRTLRIPPLGLQREPLPGQTKLPVALKTQIEGSFKQELLRPKSPIDMMRFQIPGLPLVLIQFQRFGQTALAVKVLRPPTMDVEAVSVCLSGLDNAEDEAALNATAIFLIGGDTRDHVTRGVATLIGIVREEPRPAGIHLHMDEASYDSQAVRVVTDCMVEAFFDQFGADKIDPRS